MIITICLLILAGTIFRKPVGDLLKKLEGVDWKDVTRDAWSKIVTYSKKAGRSATRVVLKFYYTMSECELSTLDKALIYAGIAYIVIPGDLLPRKALGALGVLDDVGVATWLYKKIGSNITPEIELMVERTLDEWFGPEITMPQGGTC